MKILEKSNFKKYQPLPIKKIGEEIFFTDGHTRAFILWQQEITEINVYDDPDRLDWIMYLLNIKWCRDSNIISIGDLNDRIIEEREYQRGWLDLCSSYQQKISQDPLADLVVEMEKSSKIKAQICEQILRSLPQWFGIEKAILHYIEDVKTLPFFKISIYGKTIGFCAIKVNYGVNADLYVLGIFKEFHGKGIGKRLIGTINEYCKQLNIPYMSVKTLSEKHPDKNYWKTRKFYEKCGFKPFEEFTDLWGEHSPCLYMIREVK
ncbi:MAG: GNAT family N-acetyltransferase [bacterium]